MTEQWRDVDGWKGIYQVSNLGRVRSLDHEVTNGRGSWVRPGIVLKPFPNPKGYLTVRLGRRTLSVHRLVLIAFVGEPDAGQEGRHLNGDNQDNRLANLAWGNKTQNTWDMIRHGTHVQARKTHCPQGHPYDEANTIYRRTGGRQCRTCKRAAWHRWNQSRKAA